MYSLKTLLGYNNKAIIYNNYNITIPYIGNILNIGIIIRSIYSSNHFDTSISEISILSNYSWGGLSFGRLFNEFFIKTHKILANSRNMTNPLQAYCFQEKFNILLFI